MILLWKRGLLPLFICRGGIELKQMIEMTGLPGIHVGCPKMPTKQLHTIHSHIFPKLRNKTSVDCHHGEYLKFGSLMSTRASRRSCSRMLIWSSRDGTGFSWCSPIKAFQIILWRGFISSVQSWSNGHNLTVTIRDHVFHQTRWSVSSDNYAQMSNKLIYSSHLQSIREQFNQIGLFRHQISWISWSQSLLDSFSHPRSA